MDRLPAMTTNTVLKDEEMPFQDVWGFFFLFFSFNLVWKMGFFFPKWIFVGIV